MFREPTAATDGREMPRRLASIFGRGEPRGPTTTSALWPLAVHVAAAERLLAPLVWGAVPASLFTSISGAARLRLLGYRPFWNQHISCLWLTRCAVVPLPPRSCQHLTCSRERGEKKEHAPSKTAICTSPTCSSPWTTYILSPGPGIPIAASDR